MLPTTTLAGCRHCGHTLRGRSDKKFCDDQCRNAFNNERNSTRYALVRRVNAVLLRNRRILAALLEQQSETEVSREELLLHGFQFRYSTHHYQAQDGTHFQFCYDYGWCELLPERVLLVKRDALSRAIA
ncbi:MAG: hypothetical protein EOO08_08880 [Chitinophagaceae bacterium]|nr:MAG: hypothetical protein EOO08_08880 [Chitinophagaceae bacterium]